MFATALDRQQLFQKYKEKMKNVRVSSDHNEVKKVVPEKVKMNVS